MLFYSVFTDFLFAIRHSDDFLLQILTSFSKKNKFNETSKPLLSVVFRYTVGIFLYIA